MVLSDRNPVLQWAIKVSLFGLLLLSTACSLGNRGNNTLPYYNDDELTPSWPRQGAANSHEMHQIGPFSLSDQANRTITEADMNQKIVVANFFFTHCGGICPTTMAQMKRIQMATQGDPEILLLSYTVDPERDTVETLSRYVQEKKILSDRWHLLTGKKEDVYKVARESYFADKDLGQKRSEDDFLHTETFFLLDKNRRIRGLYTGTIPREVNKLLQDLKTLKSEERGRPRPSDEQVSGGPSFGSPLPSEHLGRG